MLFYGILLAVAAGWLTGGRLLSLSTHHLRLEAVLMFLLVAMALLPTFELPISDKILVLGAWVTPVVLCIGVAISNVKEVGFGLILAGLFLNLVVVSANLGMPVITSNLALIEESETANAALDESWLHLAAEPDSHMLMLADVIPVPGPRNFRGMLSVGDFLLIVGIAKFIFVGMHDHPAVGDEDGSDFEGRSNSIEIV